MAGSVGNFVAADMVDSQAVERNSAAVDYKETSICPPSHVD